MPHPTDIAVGKRLRHLRHAHGMTQTDVAESLNLSVQQIQKYEAGTNRIPASRLFYMAKLFNAPIDTLFCNAEKLTKPIIPRQEAKAVIQAFTPLIPSQHQLIKQLILGIIEEQDKQYSII